MNRVGTKRARDASARSTFRVAFGTVDQEQLQIDSKKHKNMSFDVVGDCDDLVRGSKRPATRDEQQAFAKNFHTAPRKRSRKKTGPRNMRCNDTAQLLATSFLDYPRDMQPQAQQDEPQALSSFPPFPSSFHLLSHPVPSFFPLVSSFFVHLLADTISFPGNVFPVLKQVRICIPDFVLLFQSGPASS